ncbi:hypothetical protein ZWY2020_027861 [Hordeum vulgare]|nr:hypothetical protein ZWY2020_027861 [Hordeum vulgare]
MSLSLASVQEFSLVDLATRNEQIWFCTKAIQPGRRLRRDVPSMVSEVGGKNLQEVSRLLHELFENSFHMINLFFPHLPIPQHRRRDEVRGRPGEILHEIVRSRRRITPARFADNSDDDEGDVLQYFINSKYSNGRSMTDSEIVGLLIAILFAGQHTSSSTSTWTGACLLSQQKYMAAAREEQKQIIEQNGEPIDYITLSKMGTLCCCIKEALRLYFQPQYYSGMHTRASPGGQTGGKFSDISFGAGRYSCLGQDYAFMQIKVIWSYLLRNFELELISFP